MKKISVIISILFGISFSGIALAYHSDECCPACTPPAPTPPPTPTPPPAPPPPPSEAPSPPIVPPTFGSPVPSGQGNTSSGGSGYPVVPISILNPNFVPTSPSTAFGSIQMPVENNPILPRTGIPVSVVMVLMFLFLILFINLVGRD